jgi:hypothetical protein
VKVGVETASLLFIKVGLTHLTPAGKDSRVLNSATGCEKIANKY